MIWKNDKRVALGVNAASGAGAAELAESGGWLLLAPYGETPYWHEAKPGGGEWKQFRQVFTRAQGERMTAAFNALAERKGEQFRGLPIYAGHPDADPTRWPDERRLGGVVGVQARGDGLYVRAAWNDLGEQNRAQGYLVYPSPAWLYDVRAARASGVIAPDELRSVGLTNTPRLPDVPAWTNSGEPFSESNNGNDHMNYKALLTQHLGLPEDASDEVIQQAHDERQRAAQTAQEGTTAACAERDQAVADTRRFRAAAVNALLDAAINAGRLSAAEREGFAARFERDYEETQRALGERRPALNTQPLGLRPVAAGRDLSTAHGRAAAFNARLDTLMRPLPAGRAGAALRRGHRRDARQRGGRRAAPGHEREIGRSIFHRQKPRHTANKPTRTLPMNEAHPFKYSELDPDPDAVLTRQRAMVEAGTHPMIADRLAREAAQNQFLRERQIKLAATVVREPVVATVPVVVSEAVPVGAANDQPDPRA